MTYAKPSKRRVKWSFNYLNDRTGARMHQPTYQWQTREPKFAISLMFHLTHYGAEFLRWGPGKFIAAVWDDDHGRRGFVVIFFPFLIVLFASDAGSKHVVHVLWGKSFFSYWAGVGWFWVRAECNILKEPFILSDGTCLILVMDATLLITNTAALLE